MGKKSLSRCSADPRFELVATFGLFVPPGYKHATRLTAFAATHGDEFYLYDRGITDKHFPQSATQLVPGRKFRVKIFQLTGTVTSEDCLVFLRSQKAVLTGVRGLSLVYELIKSELPADSSFVSFDTKDAFWVDPRPYHVTPTNHLKKDVLWIAGGYHRVPYIDCWDKGEHMFFLGFFEFALGVCNGGWGYGCCLLCFCDYD